MRIIFMGTPEFSVPSLQALHKHHEVLAVVTAPDAVRKRGKQLDPTPVKICAQALGVPVVETKRITPEINEYLQSLKPDIVVVVAFGALLPKSTIDLAPLGCINVHGSLLPRYRGAAPIQRALLAGDEQVGISIMRVVLELDAGAYCLQGSIEVGEKSSKIIYRELAQLGADLLREALSQIEDSTVEWTEQDECLVTYAQKISKDEMKISPALSAFEAFKRIQSSQDSAPVRIAIGNKGVRIEHARVSTLVLEPGEVKADKTGLYLGFGTGSLEILEIKPDGKASMDALSFSRGLPKTAITWNEV